MSIEEDDSCEDIDTCVDRSPWHWWSRFATLSSDVSDLFGVVLELPQNLPEEYVIQRWLSEPVVCLIVLTDLFITNATGHPVLPKSHQNVIRRFFKLKIQILISGYEHNSRGYAGYHRYMNWLWRSRGEDDLIGQQSRGLEDQLQEPLQPLRDNLSSNTYAIFEQDPYKYNAYEDAIYKALVDRKRQSPASDDNTEPTVDAVPSAMSGPSIIVVLGAGRGPLVQAVLSAAKKSECLCRVYAVEKNPNAVYTLQDRLANEWSEEDVCLLCGDMRTITLPEKADIFVSELLGSFGDNELSPECLDGAQRFLKDGGLSIPCSYTSYFAPFQSLQFFNETKRLRGTINSSTSTPSEMPFVVRLLNHNVLAQPEEAFTFVHPKPDPSESNSRYVCRSFKVEHDAVVHGFAGYFEAVLYKDVTLSIHPDRHSPQMVSWFPFAFPLERPVEVKSGQQVKAHLWRVVTTRHVWYEWTITEPLTTRIHNTAGQAYKIEL